MIAPGSLEFVFDCYRDDRAIMSNSIRDIDLVIPWRNLGTGVEAPNGLPSRYALASQHNIAYGLPNAFKEYSRGHGL